MLEKSLVEECWGEVLENSVRGKCCREECCRQVLEKSVVEIVVKKRWRRLLEKSGGAKF